MTPSRDWLGVRFAINVAIASTIVWYGMPLAFGGSPIWAIAAMVAASEPEVTEALRMARSRLINVLVGGLAGLLFLLVGGTNEWLLPIALGTTVLVSTYVVRIKTMWRQGPITAALVIASGVTQQSTALGIGAGTLKVAEVLFGSFVGVGVSLVMSRVWLVGEADPTEPDSAPAK